MKKSTKIILYVVVFAIIGGLIALWALSGTGQDVTTSEFYDKMGVVFINETNKNLVKDGKININGTEYQIAYDGTNGQSGSSFVIIKKDGSDSISKIVIQTYNLIGLNSNGVRIYKTSYSRGNVDEAILLAFQSINGNYVDYSDPNEGSFFSSMNFIASARGSSKRSSLSFSLHILRISASIFSIISGVKGKGESIS